MYYAFVKKNWNAKYIYVYITSEVVILNIYIFLNLIGLKYIFINIIFFLIYALLTFR